MADITAGVNLFADWDPNLTNDATKINGRLHHAVNNSMQQVSAKYCTSPPEARTWFISLEILDMCGNTLVCFDVD